MNPAAIKRIVRILLVASFCLTAGLSTAQNSRTVLGLTLQGIAYSSRGVSMVVINETMYKEGAVVRGYTIERIEPDHVIVSKKGKKYTLSLKEEVQASREKKPDTAPVAEKKQLQETGIFARIRRFKQLMIKRREPEKEMGIIKSGQE